MALGFEETRTEDVLTLYWWLDDGHYYGVLPDGKAVRTATQMGLFSTLCCRARGGGHGGLRLRFVETDSPSSHELVQTPQPLAVSPRR